MYRCVDTVLYAASVYLTVAGLPRSDAQWGGVMDSTFVVVAARPPGRTAHLPAKPSPLAREYDR